LESKTPSSTDCDAPEGLHEYAASTTMTARKRRTRQRVRAASETRVPGIAAILAAVPDQRTISDAPPVSDSHVSGWSSWTTMGQALVVIAREWAQLDSAHFAEGDRPQTSAATRSRSSNRAASSKSSPIWVSSAMPPAQETRDANQTC
jgi:hypothetical protein